MASEERNAEIWSTRIQQELLALTTDNADLESTEARSMLPPFTSVIEHKLDIAEGTCVLSVEVAIEKKKEDGEIVKDIVGVAVEASLSKNPDGSINGKIPSYPFVPPVARLTSGKSLFPPGSTIQEGGRIGIDLDWTPSLHLTDAVMNIGLKVKESILQKEPFHAEPEPDHIADAVDEMAKGAHRFVSKLGQKASSFGKHFTPKGDRPNNSSSNRQNKKKKNPPPPKAIPGDVKIGDEINLLEEPWVEAHGVYSCKAIRRPPFIEELIERVSKKQEQFSSPGAMFRSFAQSARSVMEESFLMVTDTYIIELKASKLNMQIGTVTFCIPIEQMAKLKFRRQESLSLFFKAAPDDPLIYMCPDSGDAVYQIQSVLKSKGVRGKHTNAAAYRAINEAIQMVQAIQTKEMALEHEPSVERVNEIMDLYRQAAERFEIAGDIRHEEVVTHMRKFLAKSTVTRILDGSAAKAKAAATAKPTTGSGAPQGEVLEKSHAHHDDVDSDEEDHHAPVATPASKDDESDKAFEENIDNLLKDAKEDFENFTLDDDTLETDAPTAESGNGADGLADMAADLDAMMKEADKELAELMSS